MHCPLSGPDLTYISLLIIPCIIYHVTNKEILNLDEGNTALGEPEGEAGGNSPSVGKQGSHGTAGVVENMNGEDHRND